MHYDIKAAADELLFTQEELLEVIDIFFEEAVELIEECYAHQQAKNFPALAKTLHKLKGAAYNLRINTLAELAASLEIQARSAQADCPPLEIPQLEEEVTELKALLADLPRLG